MIPSDYLEDAIPPKLSRLISLCSNFSDQDKPKQMSGIGLPVQLIKMQSYIEPLNEIEFMHPLQMSIQAEGVETNEEKAKPQIQEENIPVEKKETEYQCSCTKTNCLKMYCSCFHNGQNCGKQCKCDGCLNKESHHIEKKSAVEYVKKKANRNKKVPKEKLFETSEVWGCNCSKTRCIKNYCECFIRGKKCTVECNCDNCDNGKDEDLFNEIKRQNEKPSTSKRIRKERQISYTN